MVRSSYKAGELFIEAMMDEDEEKSTLEQQLGKTAETDWQGRGRIAKHEKHGKALALETGATS